MAKQITHEEYVARVAVAQASWEVITGYLGMNKKITFSEKETGVRWTAFAKTPFQGVSAPKPGSKRCDDYVDWESEKGFVITGTVTGRIPAAPLMQEIPNDRVISNEPIPVTLENADYSEIEARTITHLDEAKTPEAMFQAMLDDTWGGDVQFTGAHVPVDHKNKVALLHVPTGTKYRTTMNASLKKLPKNVVAA